MLLAAAAAKSLQSCPTLRDPIDGSPPGSTEPGILQAKTLECVAIFFSNVWKWSHSIVSDSQWSHGLQPTRLLHPWNFPGKSTGVGCHCLLRWLNYYYFKLPVCPPISSFSSLLTSDLSSASVFCSKDFFLVVWESVKGVILRKHT